MLSLENINKSFGEIRALRNVSLEVADGEFMVLLGPTGAGKTTALRVTAGLERPEEGRVCFDGEDVTDAHPAARDVAFVFQEYCLYPRYTVYDNMAFPLRSPLRRLPQAQIDETVRRTARTLGIERLLDRLPSQLSGGEMQRVALGRAIVRRPRLFLMDEPLSNLDAKLREQMRVELKHLQVQQGAATLYVTHDQTEAMSMGDRLAVLHRGAIQQVGSPLEVYDRPVNMTVARLLGSPPMNLAPCRRVEGGRLNVGPGTFAVEPPPGSQPSGRELNFGIRPEDIALSRRGDGAVAELQADVVQSIGAEDIVGVRVGDRLWKVRAPKALQARAGERFAISLNMSKAHIFAGRIEDADVAANP